MSVPTPGIPTTPTIPPVPLKDTQNQSVLDIFDWSSVESASDISR